MGTLDDARSRISKTTVKLRTDSFPIAMKMNKVNCYTSHWNICLFLNIGSGRDCVRCRKHEKCLFHMLLTTRIDGRRISKFDSASPRIRIPYFQSAFSATASYLPSHAATHVRYFELDRSLTGKNYKQKKIQENSKKKWKATKNYKRFSSKRIVFILLNVNISVIEADGSLQRLEYICHPQYPHSRTSMATHWHLHKWHTV